MAVLRDSRAGWLLLAVLTGLPVSTVYAADIVEDQVSAPEQSIEPTLTLDAVLLSSRRHAPQILEAIARVRQAEARLVTAEGAFDTVVAAEGSARLSGFYDGSSAAATITRPLENWGGSLYGGYRVSGGRFPIYEDKSFTNVLGELKVGAVFALMRDRFIDDRRFNRGNAAIDIDVAEAENLMTAISVQRRAIAAYNLWVGAGLRLGIYRELLALAKERQQGFVKQVAAGARARILLTENEQNILRRETLVARSEQELANAANTLSLFWRDAAGAPRKPLNSQLPSNFPLFNQVTAAARQALAFRPDLKTIELRLNQATYRLALDRNSLRPRLDVNVEVSNDFGPVGVGGPSRSGTESIVGLKFSVPLQQRAATGRIAQTNAEIDAIKRRRQLTEEQIIAELDGIAIDVGATNRLSLLAEQEQARAREMAEAERRRFMAGASDFFLVNLREEAAADAAVRQLDAEFRNIVANAELAAAAVDLKSLRLD